MKLYKVYHTNYQPTSNLMFEVKGVTLVEAEDMVTAFNEAEEVLKKEHEDNVITEIIEVK